MNWAVNIGKALCMDYWSFSKDVELADFQGKHVMAQEAIELSQKRVTPTSIITVNLRLEKAFSSHPIVNWVKYQDIRTIGAQLFG